MTGRRHLQLTRELMSSQQEQLEDSMMLSAAMRLGGALTSLERQQDSFPLIEDHASTLSVTLTDDTFVPEMATSLELRHALIEGIRAAASPARPGVRVTRARLFPSTPPPPRPPDAPSE